MLVLTGSPGVGKHTVSIDLAKSLGYEIVDINKEAIKAGMPKQNDSIDVDIKQMQELLKGIITDKTLIVGHLAVYVISKTQVSKVVVLRKNPYDLIPIYEKRKYADGKKNDNLGSEILGIIAYDSIKKFGESKTFQVNTTSLTQQQTIKKIEGVISGDSNGDTVDWLTEISKKNDLSKDIKKIITLVKKYKIQSDKLDKLLIFLGKMIKRIILLDQKILEHYFRFNPKLFK